MSNLTPKDGPGEDADDLENFYRVIIQKTYFVEAHERSVLRILRGEIAFVLEHSNLRQELKATYMVEFDAVLKRMVSASGGFCEPATTNYFDEHHQLVADHEATLKDEWIEILQEVADKIAKEIQMTDSALPTAKRPRKPLRIPKAPSRLRPSSIPPITVRERLVTGDFTAFTIPPAGIPTLHPPDVVSGWPAPPPLPDEKKPK